MVLLINFHLIQIDEEQISPGSGINIYQPRYSLLASVLLRLGHTHILMAGRPTTDPIDRSNLLSKAQECFKEGLDIIHDSTHFDPCLSCELLFANGKSASRSKLLTLCVTLIKQLCT